MVLANIAITAAALVVIDALGVLLLGTSMEPLSVYVDVAFGVLAGTLLTRRWVGG